MKQYRYVTIRSLTFFDLCALAFFDWRKHQFTNVLYRYYMNDGGIDSIESVIVLIVIDSYSLEDIVFFLN